MKYSIEFIQQQFNEHSNLAISVRVMQCLIYIENNMQEIISQVKPDILHGLHRRHCAPKKFFSIKSLRFFVY